MDNETQNATRRYQCPLCGAMLETDGDIDGMQVACPVCGGEFIAAPCAPESVAEQSAAAEPETPLAPPPPASAQSGWKGKLESASRNLVPLVRCFWQTICRNKALNRVKSYLSGHPKARIGAAVGAGVLVILLLCPSCPGSLGEGKRAGEKRTIKLPGGAKMEMVWCPPGTFLMGSPQSEKGRKQNETQHQVRLTQGFWMARTEVTQGQWKSVMGSNPSRHTGNDKLPVEEVTWNDCMRFCQKTGLQLPTEAQWEYACRAGTKTPYHWEHLLSGGHQGNFLPYPSWDFSKPNDDFLKVNTCPVKENWSNPWGFYNMHGNVREWCADWYGPYQGGPEINPKGPSSGYARVMRGGAATSHSDECRSASRESRGPTDDPYLWTGFRPVLIP